MKDIFLFFIVALALPLLCWSEPSDSKLKTLYNSLDPTSISQHLAFYELYPQRTLGQRALKDAWHLLSGKAVNPELLSEFLFSGKLIQSLVSLVNKPIDQELPILDDDIIVAIAKLSERLHHHKLKGHFVWSEHEVLSLPLEEIDVARGLFLSQFGSDKHKIQSYEAMIDLMALQILARLSPTATPKEKITAINTFIFDEMGFRFPPHSLCTKDIELYSFLPSVLDSRRGVCLGVSILYICIAQRLALPLEMITPPGHIYVRYREGDNVVNIETTARGIHLDSDEYLTVSTCALQKRTVREVIGMAHFNQASGYWQIGDYEKALHAYQKAEPYMRGDPLLKELTGYTLILTGQKEEGEKLLFEIKDVIPECSLVRNTMIDDYFQGNVDANGISVIFSHVEEDRQSLLTKKIAVEKILEKCPQFRAGILHLAVTWLQLHRAKEALESLIRYEAMDSKDPEIHYYLSVLYAQRHHFPKAWFHLKEAERITKAHNYSSKILKELRRELIANCPE